MKTKLMIGLSGLVSLALAQNAMATCGDVSRAQLTAAVNAAAAASTGGYGLNMWATLVDETGKVCHVVTNGATGTFAGNSEWLGSRVISAQKAFTANAFSLDGYAISTANLYSAVQPGGSLYGLQHSNPVDASEAYDGSPSQYGTNNDPLKGDRVGGVNVFGGGLAIYKGGVKVGAIGVSGDTSCRDHAFAWQVRTALNGHPGGVGITTANFQANGSAPVPATVGTVGDEMILNANGTTGGSADYWDAWSQPLCPNSTPAATAANGTVLN
jgi:uncharacterized protein GlcG (DUF336 family)